MSALGSLVVSLSLDYAQYTQGLDKSSQEALKFAKNAQRSFDEASVSVKNFLKGTAAQAAAAIGGMVALNQSFNRSLEFSKSLAQISTQLDSAGDDLGRLEAAAKSLAVQFGTLPIDQTKAFYEIISAGTEDVTKATEILTTANKLAIIGVTDLATSVGGLTDIMNSYSGKVESAEAVSDALFVGMKAGKASMEDFSAHLAKVTPLATSLNVSFDELVSAIAALSKTGGETSEKITGLRAILASIAKPSVEAAKLANQLGLEFNASALQAKGLAGFLEEVSQKTGGSVDTIAKLFGGVEALVPMLALAGQSGKDFAQIMQDMANKAGATEEALEKIAVPGDKFRELMSSIEVIALSVGDALANVLAPAAGAAADAINNLFGIKQLSAIDQQKQKIAELQEQLASMNDRKNIPVIGGLIFDKRQADLLSQQIEDSIADLARMEEATAKSSVTIKEEAKALNTLDTALKPVTESRSKNTSATRIQVSEADRFIQSLRKEVEQLGKTNTETKRLEAAKLGVSKVADPLINKIEQEEKALRDASDAAANYKNQLSKAAQIAESVMTDEERFAQTQAELNQLLNAGALDVDTYNRALSKAQESLNKTRDTGKQAFNELDQFAVQAARNLQTSFADALANGLEGFKNFGKSVWSILKNLAAQIASAKILQGVGLGGALGLGSGSAAASGFDLMGLAKSGFGITNAVSSLGSSLPGSVGSFFSGMGGGAIPGVSSQSALMGAQFAEFAAPLAAMAIGTAMGSFIGGDKKIGGMSSTVTSLIGSVIGGPLGGIIGGGINALFGRGPLKQKETFIDATLGADGFESGILQTGFKAKGGLFRSDKRDFARVNLLTGGADTDNIDLQSFADKLAAQSKGIIQLFNDTAKATSSSLHNVADALGLSTDALDNYSTHISLTSESGQFLTEQQIADEIARISNEMVHSLVPGIDALSKSGESALITVQRLGDEFASLENAAAILSGSASAATAAVQALSFEQRTALVDQAGGAGNLNQMIGFFGENFLSSQEQYNLEFAALDKQLSKFGLSANMTKEEYVGLVKSVTQAGGASNELAIELLKLGPLFLQVKNHAEQLANVDIAPAIDDRQLKLDAVMSAYASLQRSVEAERTRLTNEYNAALDDINTQIQNVTGSISKLTSLSDALKSTVGKIQPLSIENAQQVITAAVANARQGVFPELDELQPALQTLASQTTDAFSTRSEFNIAQAKNVNLLDELGDLTDDQLDIDKASLDALNDSAKTLKEGFDAEITRLNNILTNAEQQVSLLTGINTGIMELKAALEAFNVAVRRASTVSSSDIASFVASNPDPMAQYNAAIANGVTALQYSQATGTPVSAINNFTSANGLAPLARGFGQSDVNEYFRNYGGDNIRAARDAFQFGATSTEIAKATGFSIAEIDAFTQSLGLGKLSRYSNGGFTGSGGKFQPAGIVHAGEYVFSQEAVNKLGVSTLDKLHAGAKKGSGFADGGLVGSVRARIIERSNTGDESSITNNKVIDLLTKVLTKLENLDTLSATNEDIRKFTEKAADILDSVSAGGDAFLVESGT